MIIGPCEHPLAVRADRHGFYREAMPVEGVDLFARVHVP